MNRWYARPVFFVEDVETSLRFYVEKLGFEQSWRKGTVCQVNRNECEIILCQDRARKDKGRLFVELTPEGREELRRDISKRQVPFDNIWWGYDCIRIVDPGGHELLFPLE